MSNLTRWDPFREMVAFRSLMNRMIEDSLSPTGIWREDTWNLALDVSETGDDYVVKASLPGLKPEDLEITFENNVLSIKGEIREEKESEQQRYHLRERRSGSFYRSLSLPSTVNADGIEARYDAGVLTLRLPKAEEARPKRIAVKGGQAPQMIEGKAKEIASKN